MDSCIFPFWVVFGIRFLLSGSFRGVVLDMFSIAALVVLAVLSDLVLLAALKVLVFLDCAVVAVVVAAFLAVLSFAAVLSFLVVLFLFAVLVVLLFLLSLDCGRARMYVHQHRLAHTYRPLRNIHTYGRSVALSVK